MIAAALVVLASLIAAAGVYVLLCRSVFPDDHDPQHGANMLLLPGCILTVSLIGAISGWAATGEEWIGAASAGVLSTAVIYRWVQVASHRS